MSGNDRGRSFRFLLPRRKQVIPAKAGIYKLKFSFIGGAKFVHEGLI